MPHTPGVSQGSRGIGLRQLDGTDPGFLPLSLWRGTWSLDGNRSFEFPFFSFFFFVIYSFSRVVTPACARSWEQGGKVSFDLDG